MQRYRAILFDAGFTILGIWPSWDEHYMAIAKRHGLELAPEDISRARLASQAFFEGLYYRPNDIWASDEAIARFWIDYYRLGLEALAVPPALVPACARELAAVVDDPASWRAYDDVPPALAAFRQAGYKLAVVSDWASSLEPILTRAGLRPYLDFLVVSAVERLAKPQPAFFRRALQRAGVEPEQALMVGDNYYADIQGAAGAGIRGILIDRQGHHADLPVPRIRQLDELWQYLEEA